MLFSLFCVLVNCFPTPGPLTVLNSYNDEFEENNTIIFSPGLSKPTVWTQLGGLEGFFMKTIKGRSIAAFQGIPYAQPPIGNLRFRKAVPINPWQGVKKATKFGNTCLQLNIFKYFITEGNEDCLYLNVYTPLNRKELDAGKPLLPVIMFIHGGGHLSGTGSDYGPSYLLDRDVILVTINYRVGILGFLSTGDEASPGNNGLKDQLLALQWVHSNIKSFGGDPKRINLMGQSVAGGHVALHMISSKSSKYISGGICHSGSSFSHWAIQNETIYTSELIAESFGCPTARVGKSQEMVDCLRNQNAYLLVSRILKFYENKILAPTHLPIGPVIEEPSEESFLEQAPQVLYAQNKVKNIPMLSGVVENEGDIFAAGPYLLPGQIRTISRRWYELLPFFLAYDYDNRADDVYLVSSRIWEYYFKDVPWGFQNLPNISQVIGDRTITQGVYYGLQHHSQVAPTYAYHLSFKGKYSFLENLGINPSEWGVSHVDDLIYLFNSSSLYKPISVNDYAEFAMMEFMTNVWVNFAATGKPFYADSNNKLIEFWEPVQNPLEMKVMELNLVPQMIPFPFAKDRIRFWSNLHLRDDHPLT